MKQAKKNKEQSHLGKVVGEYIPISLASILFIFLIFEIIRKIYFDSTEYSQNLLYFICKISETISSDSVRNLSLLLVASIGWYFLYRRTVTADKNAEAAVESAKIAEQGLTAASGSPSTCSIMA